MYFAGIIYPETRDGEEFRKEAKGSSGSGQVCLFQKGTHRFYLILWVKKLVRLGSL